MFVWDSLGFFVGWVQIRDVDLDAGSEECFVVIFLLLFFYGCSDEPTHYCPPPVRIYVVDTCAPFALDVFMDVVVLEGVYIRQDAFVLEKQSSRSERGEVGGFNDLVSAVLKVKGEHEHCVSGAGIVPSRLHPASAALVSNCPGIVSVAGMEVAFCLQRVNRVIGEKIYGGGLQCKVANLMSNLFRAEWSFGDGRGEYKFNWTIGDYYPGTIL